VTMDGVVELKEVKNGQRVYIFANQVFCVTFNPVLKAVVVMGPGSVAVPVEGSVDEVLSAIKRVKKEANNGV
jgi:hypothetical protein